MCNLYGIRATAAEIRGYFEDAEKWRRQIHDTPANFASEVYPGYSGMVLAGDTLRSMVWGFPLRYRGMKPTSKPKPVNNTRADKLDSFMWRDSFKNRRCLIPVTEFAEAEGEQGRKTRTWFKLPDEPIFAVAGIWRESDEWGPVYSMVMTEACIHVADVHDRMPVIVKPEHWSDWLDGPPDDAAILCRPYPDLMIVDRTDQPWSARRAEG